MTAPQFFPRIQTVALSCPVSQVFLSVLDSDEHLVRCNLSPCQTCHPQLQAQRALFAHPIVDDASYGCWSSLPALVSSSLRPHRSGTQVNRTPQRLQTLGALGYRAGSVASSRTLLQAAQPLERDVYKVDFGEDVAWLQQADADPPIIIFSKTYCPYSKKAKELLKSYDLSPKPKIVEVDLRSDADQIKMLLSRLTKHATFPSIFIGGKPYGGFDDLKKLDSNGSLLTLLSDAGVSINVEG